MIWQLAFRRIARIWKRWRTMGCSRLVGKCCQPLLPGAELRGSRGAIAPPPKFCLARQKFFSLLLKVLHRPLTAPLVAKLAPPNENVWLHPWLRLSQVAIRLLVRPPSTWNLCQRHTNVSIFASEQVFIWKDYDIIWRNKPFNQCAGWFYYQSNSRFCFPQETLVQRLKQTTHGEAAGMGCENIYFSV